MQSTLIGFEGVNRTEQAVIPPLNSICILSASVKCVGYLLLGFLQEG